MSEPSSPTVGGAALLASLAASLGPLLAEWALIFIGAFVGAFLAVTALQTLTVKAAVVVLLRGIGMALLFTGVAALMLSPILGQSAGALLLPVAGLIAWRQDKLLALGRRFFESKGMP